MLRTYFYPWCILVVSISQRHIGYGARTDPRRSLILSEDHHIQSRDVAGYLNQVRPWKEYLSVKQSKVQFNKSRGNLNNSVVTNSRKKHQNDGNATSICRKKNNDSIEWRCTKIASCNVSKESQSATQQTVCGKKGSSQKICCPYIPAAIVAQEKCREYSEFRYVNETIIPDNIAEEPFIRRILDCPNQEEDLIVGDEMAAGKEFPHMALIGNEERNEWMCGGSLISPQYVLSAAHCNDPNSSILPTWVVLGLRNKPRDDANISNDNLYRIEERINHPQYSSPKADYDIALFKLERPVVLSSLIRPICLALPQYVERTTQPVTATGWGQMGTGQVESDVLLKVSLDRLDKHYCVDTYKNDPSKLRKGFNTKTMICAGRLDAEKDTCTGDSGGPIQSRLYHEDYLCMWLQEGIISFDGSFCGDKTPTVYTRVSNFLPWIQPIVWPTQNLESL